MQHGTPEILFIKRANRVGDKWTGHVAFPGGRRDPEDDSDLAAAIRETQEEVGIALTPANAIQVGNLAQQVVTSTWHKKAYVSYGPLARNALASPASRSRSTVDDRLMILCPYIFLITNPNLPPVRLQPTEVGSTHWVSVPALLSPALRTFEYQDVSGLMKRGALIPQWFVRALVGRMMFAAVRLLPSESIYCTAVPGFIPDEPVDPELAKVTARHAPLLTKLRNTLFPWTASSAAAAAALRPPEPILWGLTLGIVSDFLDALPPQNSMQFWVYPTFTAPDVRWLLWLLSYRVRRRKEREMGRDQNMIPVDTITAASKTGRIESRSAVASEVLEDYFSCIRPAWLLALLGRTTVAAAVGVWVVRKYLEKRGQ